MIRFILFSMRAAYNANVKEMWRGQQTQQPLQLGASALDLALFKSQQRRSGIGVSAQLRYIATRCSQFLLTRSRASSKRLTAR